MNATVIINTYKENTQHLNQAIKSYQDQIGVDMQIIVSTVSDDPNMGVLENHDVNLIVLDKKDHPGYKPEGSFAQLNNAIRFIVNDWVTFASSNDVADPYKLLDEIYGCLRNGKKVCYSDIAYVNEDLGVKSITSLQAYDRARHQEGNFVADCSTVAAELYKEFTPFPWEEIGNFCYWDMWLRIYEKYGNVFHYNPQPTWSYRQNGGMHMKPRPAGYDQQRQAMLNTHPL